jgi:hypothetical protein
VKDPLSLNRWGYTKDNPIRFTDPSGHYVYDRAKAVNYAMAWDYQSSLDPTYDFTGNQCYAGINFENQCSLFASIVLHYGGVEDPRPDPYKNGLSDNSSLYYWNIDGLVKNNYYSEKGCQYQPYTAIQTSMFYNFASSQIGKKLFDYPNPPYYNDSMLYKNDSIDQAWENLLSANRGTILPGDLVFYGDGSKWDHVAVVVGWGSPTHFGLKPNATDFNPNHPLQPASGMAGGREYLDWIESLQKGCPKLAEMHQRPLVVERSGGIAYTSFRSLDNTVGKYAKIAIVHIENH